MTHERIKLILQNGEHKYFFSRSHDFQCLSQDSWPKSLAIELRSWVKSQTGFIKEETHMGGGGGTAAADENNCRETNWCQIFERTVPPVPILDPLLRPADLITVIFICEKTVPSLFWRQISSRNWNRTNTSNVWFSEGKREGGSLSVCMCGGGVS